MPPKRAVPEVLSAEYLVERWPRLFHMAEAGSWASIRRHGLLSTTALLDLFEIRGPTRDAIESARRPTLTRIDHPQHGTAWIRDNRPISPTVLRRTLASITEPEWYRTLNGRVYFWLTRTRLDVLREAAFNRGRPHEVLTLDTASLLAAHGAEVELSPRNSGAVSRGSRQPIGRETFRPIEQYPWAERLRVARAEPIVELTIAHAVTDIARFVIDVETV